MKRRSRASFSCPPRWPRQAPARGQWQEPGISCVDPFERVQNVLDPDLHSPSADDPRDPPASEIDGALAADVRLLNTLRLRFGSDLVRRSGREPEALAQSEIGVRIPTNHMMFRRVAVGERRRRREGGRIEPRSAERSPRAGSSASRSGGRGPALVAFT